MQKLKAIANTVLPTITATLLAAIELVVVYFAKLSGNNYTTQPQEIEQIEPNFYR